MKGPGVEAGRGRSSVSRLHYFAGQGGCASFRSRLRRRRLAEADALIVPDSILHEVTEDDRFSGGRLVLRIVAGCRGVAGGIWNNALPYPSGSFTHMSERSLYRRSGHRTGVPCPNHAPFGESGCTDGLADQISNGKRSWLRESYREWSQRHSSRDVPVPAGTGAFNRNARPQGRPWKHDR